eukprot:7073222-Alexandrium_andersonii.AAC.1
MARAQCASAAWTTARDSPPSELHEAWYELLNAAVLGEVLSPERVAECSTTVTDTQSAECKHGIAVHGADHREKAHTVSPESKLSP